MIKAHSAGIGDILRSSAAWAVLKNRWPNVELHLVFLTRWPGYPSEGLIQEHHLLSSTHFLPMQMGRLWGMRGVGPRTWGRLLPALRKIAKQVQPDLIIDHEPFGLETSLVALWLRRLSKAPIVGVNQVLGRGLLYDFSGPSLQEYAQQRQLSWPMDYTERDFAALTALGLYRKGQKIVLAETESGRLFREQLQRRLPEEGVPVIGLNIGCGTPDAEQKRPDVDLLVSVFGRAQQEVSFILLLTGSPDERDINLSFIKKYQEQWGDGQRLIDLAGLTTLSSLTGVIALCDGFISSDSGPYHMAVAQGIPTMALFNFASPEHYHKEASIVMMNGFDQCSLVNFFGDINNPLLRKTTWNG
ncbi:glycosyltransferase family 9 protein [Acidithiobacillus sp. M4-SHS-6]|uniref:glycosyltransferase family 9 protein n=1 Tax=Acidithiobacillus sp. M4-SHS-6 TaxID=3383024 RepID=UPI0039BE7187